MSLARTLFVVWTVCLSTAAAQAPRPEQMLADALFPAYVAGDGSVLLEAFPNLKRFEEFRQDFRKRVLPLWERRVRQPLQAMFMLDVAVVAQQRRFSYWADFVYVGTTFLIERTSPPGANPGFDEFEIAWHKAAITLHHGRRRPDLVAAATIALDDRLAASREASATPVLVDPWIELARGYAQEGFTIEDPTRLDRLGREALVHYQEAAKHAATRAEAIVRSARVLTRLGRPAEAVSMLDGFDDRWTMDGVIRYWRRLFHGDALDALGRPDDAITAFREALTVVPSAQSPRVAMMAIEARRDHGDAAEQWATAVRTAPDVVIDPWWTYAHGDFRFLRDRIQAARALSRR
jgi:hypothetical protein